MAVAKKPVILEPFEPYRTVFLDIENFPNLGYTWEKYDQNVLDFEQQWVMCSWAAEWQDNPGKVEVRALCDYKGYKKNPFDDSKLVDDLYDVFDTADHIIAHNGKSFDRRKSNTRIVMHDITPPSPIRWTDTLLTARKHFMFNSNKLDDLCRTLWPGNPKYRKVPTGGFQLWLGCWHNDPASWATMKKYNAHDVTLLKDVYYRFRPWMETHPNITLGTGVIGGCPNCGKTEWMRRRGICKLKTTMRQSWWCSNEGKNQGCGKYSKGPAIKSPGLILSA